MISGESGTGKELVAHALHEYGRRRNGPFVAVNMAALPREQIESELFGFERTGAQGRMPGRFEQATGGTLFLDEIGDMPQEAQTRLLRVLQEGEFTTVGGNRPLRADVRIVAATHRDLRQAIQAGTFREDLYYRLNVVPLRLPPLRERAEDIPLLARHFLNQCREEDGRLRQIDDAALTSLQAWCWPGNVRELENLIRRVVALHSQETITRELIEAELFDAVPTGAAWHEGEEAEQAGEPLSEAVSRHIARYLAAGREGTPLHDLHAQLVAEVERPLIQMTLVETRGNQIKAAAMLGLNRNTLRKKIRELDIPVVRGAG
jgi:two-component system nitrogen regulation response regulator GlnG